jgi:hypothetical protein
LLHLSNYNLELVELQIVSLIACDFSALRHHFVIFRIQASLSKNGDTEQYSNV